MTESEAIKELHGIRPRGGIIPQKRAEAIDMAINALENQMKLKEMGDCYIIPKNGVFEVNGVNVNLAIQKQIPKKPNKCIGFTESLFVCPTCGRKQPIMYEQHYCKECGQKLDWGDEE